jgi:hypothetical protein
MIKMAETKIQLQCSKVKDSFARKRKGAEILGLHKTQFNICAHPGQLYMWSVGTYIVC